MVCVKSLRERIARVVWGCDPKSVEMPFDEIKCEIVMNDLFDTVELIMDEIAPADIKEQGVADRWFGAYSLAHTQAMENGSAARRLREALEPFARMAIMDDRLSGLDPDQLRHHISRARDTLAALATATGTAKTPQAVECEASQSGPKGNAQPQGETP